MRINSIKLKNSRGATLLEALVALLLAGIVTTAIFNVYINQHKSWAIQEEIIDVQQNARAAIDELTRQIRMAGHGLPPQLDGIEAYDTNPDTIIITYASSNCEVNIEHKMPNPSAELRCDGHDVSCFQDDEWVYILDPVTGTGEFFLITHVQIGSGHIQHNTMSLSKAYDSGAVLIAINQLKYFIDYTDSLHPNLMMELPGRSPEVYSENITDLQFEYTMKNGVVVNVPAIASDIRHVNIELIGRTNNPDPDFEHDPYRTREFSSSVNLRNLY